MNRNALDDCSERVLRTSIFCLPTFYLGPRKISWLSCDSSSTNKGLGKCNCLNQRPVNYFPTIITIRQKVPSASQMPTFQSKTYRPTTYQKTYAAAYRRGLKKHPFLLFGLPFLTTMVAGSFFLTPATALRYEQHDRRVRQLTKEEQLGLGKDRRRVDINEEYYRLAAKVSFSSSPSFPNLG